MRIWRKKSPKLASTSIRIYVKIIISRKRVMWNTTIATFSFVFRLILRLIEMSAPILMFYILYSSSYLHGTACDCCDKLNYSNILAHRALKTISDIRKGNYRIDFMFGVYHGNSGVSRKNELYQYKGNQEKLCFVALKKVQQFIIITSWILKPPRKFDEGHLNIGYFRKSSK